MLKRIFDIFFSSLGIIILLPIFIAVAIWIKLDSPGPVFYRQVRVGKFGKLFKIHKFRSMYDGAFKSGGGLTVGKDPRITKSGAVIRKYKIDELPQLIDVFIGNMSLVGPRPEIEEFMNLYPKTIREKILSVKPGITDEASIAMVEENELLGKYKDPRRAYIEVIMPIKSKYYIKYVDNNSLVGDFSIILKTIRKIIKK